MGRRDPVRRLILAILFLAFAPLTAVACEEGVVDLRSDRGSVRFTIEIADEPAERRTGLMERTEMPLDHGMLFIFEQPGPLSFWMKNTPLPLDIIFIDARGVVVNVAADTRPYSLRPIPSTGPALAALEVNAGLAAFYGIGPGALVRHPAFAGDPAWPCG